MRITIAGSYGTKPVYVTSGYRDKGILAGFNTRWGGKSVWVRGDSK